MTREQQIGRNLQDIRKSLRPRVTQLEFYKRFLKNLPGLSGKYTTDGSIAKFMSNVETGADYLPPAAYAVYSEIGQVSIDWIISGREYHPAAQIFDYADALRCIALLETSGAVKISENGAGLAVTNYALENLLGLYQEKKAEAAALSPTFIESWLTVVLERLQGCPIDPDNVAEIREFYEWQRQQNPEAAAAILVSCIKSVSK